MPTPRRNSRIQVLDVVTDRHIIPVRDVDRNDLDNLHIPAQGFQSAPLGNFNPIIPGNAPQALTGTGALGAIALDTFVTTIDTTGAATATLAVATTPGTMKRIRMIGDLGDCVITVSGDGVASITLNDVGDTVELVSNSTGTGWSLVDNNGATVS